MKLKITVIALLLIQWAFGQSGIGGTVLAEAGGQPLAGVTVVVINTKISTITGADGKYFLRNIALGKVDLQFTSLGFQTKVVTEVDVLKGEIITLDVSLAETSKQLDEVVIKTVKAKAESVKTLLVMQKNNASVSDGISAESIKKTPDKSTSDVLKRISGASIQDNKFVVIRGLNDRYNAAYLNGAPLPSSEPDRKAFSFDIFPANMLDNLIITKTATPDLPGEFAGGVIQINTKSIPDRNFQTLYVGGGYNSQTTGKKQLYYEGGKTDWLGIDDGTRALSSKIPDYLTFQNLTAGERADYTQYVNSDWSLHTRNFAPNMSLQYTHGRRFDLGNDKVLGALFSLSYNRTNLYNETIRRDYDTPSDDLPSVLTTNFLDKNYTEHYLVGAIANIGLKLNKNSTISFKNIFSINSDDRVIERKGPRDEALEVNPRQLYATARWFTSNTIFSSQLFGDHFFEKSRTKFSWLASYSRVSRKIPNLRRNSYSGYDDYIDPQNPNPSDLIYQADIADGNAGPDYGGGIFFSENKEDIYSGKVDYSCKLTTDPARKDEIKMGLFVQYRDRDFFARQLQYNKLSTATIQFDGALLALDDAHIFQPQNMGEISPGVGGFTLFDGTKYFDSYTASSELQAAYVMLDQSLDKFRFVYGIRAENYIQRLLTRRTLDENLRVYNEKTDLLPSVNIIYGLTDKQNLRLSYSKTLNRPEFRELAPFGFYDFTTRFFTNGNPELQIATVNNADFRYEIFPGRNQLFSVSAFYKKFSDPIEMIAGINNKEVSYKNAKSAENYGFEMEFRVLFASLFGGGESGILNDLTLFSNLAIIHSEVNVSNIPGSIESKESRPMQGQSPYVFNSGLQYTGPENGWAASVSLNRVGPRISVVGNVEGEPTLWEMGRTLLDAQITKTFLKKKLELKLNLQNLLDQKSIFYQNKKAGNTDESGVKGIVNNIFTGNSGNNGYYKDKDDLIWSTKFGRTVSFGATYSF